MTRQDLWFVLLGIATTVNGLLAGASLDQSIEQLPARHRIGMRAYRAYSQASHMANGRFWLIPLGIGGAGLTLAAAIWAVMLNLPAKRSLPVFLAGGLAVAHTLSTLKAGSINWSLTPWQPAERQVADDEVALADILGRFERWQALRASLQFLTFAATVWALTVNSTAVSSS
jgi:hypothetical protein